MHSLGSFYGVIAATHWNIGGVIIDRGLPSFQSTGNRLLFLLPSFIATHINENIVWKVGITDNISADPSRWVEPYRKFKTFGMNNVKMLASYRSTLTPFQFLYGVHDWIIASYQSRDLLRAFYSSNDEIHDFVIKGQVLRLNKGHMEFWMKNETLAEKRVVSWLSQVMGKRK